MIKSSLAKKKTSKDLDAIIKAHNWMGKKKNVKRKQLEWKNLNPKPLPSA